MYSWRITKFDPTLRNDNGAFKYDEWTSVSDIHKKFNNIELTLESYISAENAYVNAIMLMMRSNSVDFFKISDLEKRGYDYLDEIGLDTDRKLLSILKDKDSISKNDIDKVARLILREQMWCKLSNSSMFVHFGYDYYMYIGCCEKSQIELEAIRKSGLFVEEMESPYNNRE